MKNQSQSQSSPQLKPQSQSQPKEFYFTYGCSAWQPFNSGWTKVIAYSFNQACEIFKAVHPNKNSPDLLCCAAVYSEEHFKKTDMYKFGNYGAFTQEIITLEVRRA